jgi:hypothetical protein
MKKHIVIHNEAELLAYLDFQISHPYACTLPTVKFSKEMIEASQFKLTPPHKKKKR